jgi:hypothetical protein
MKKGEFDAIRNSYWGSKVLGPWKQTYLDKEKWTRRSLHNEVHAQVYWVRSEGYMKGDYVCVRARVHEPLFPEYKIDPKDPWERTYLKDENGRYIMIAEHWENHRPREYDTVEGALKDTDRRLRELGWDLVNE